MRNWFVEVGRRKIRNAEPGFQRLENRQLLAGDVTAVYEGGILLLSGDAQANEFTISARPGRLVVTGIDTTINGAETFSPLLDPISILIRSGDGNDVVRVAQLSRTRHLGVEGGPGDDSVFLEGVALRNVYTALGEGADVLELNGVNTGNLQVELGAGDDLLAVTAMNVNHNMNVFAGEGDDLIVSNYLNVGRRLRVDAGSGDDLLLAAGETRFSHRKRNEIHTGDGSDSVLFVPGQTGKTASIGRMKVDLSGGNDRLAVTAEVSSRGAVALDGGAGTDALDQAFSGRDLQTGNFETTGPIERGLLIDRIFSTLQSAGIDSTAYGNRSTVVNVVATAGELVVVEDAVAVPLDPGLVINSVGNPGITSASVEIESFVPADEELLFTASGGITSTFNAAENRLELTGSGSASAWQQALRDVRYRYSGNNPPQDVRQISFNVTAGAQFSANRGMRITSVNDSPVIDLARDEASIPGSQLPFVLAPQLTITDDGNQLRSAVVAIANGLSANVDRLEMTQPGSLIATYDTSTGALTVSGNGTLAQYQSALRSVRYLQAAAGTGTRTIRFTVNDVDRSGLDELELTINE